MPNDEGILIRAKVRAGARKESFVEKAKGVFEITVKEPAEENRANTRVVALISRHFRISASKIRIVSGQRSPGKKLRIYR
jgi:uncharacterized protein (TIGR00251 family)